MHPSSESVPKVASESRQRFARILRGNIIGIIDAHGAVHSRFTGEEIAYHEAIWPQQTHNRWRWNHRESIHWLVAERRPDEEGIDSVMRHLTKTYGLEWWTNGHHNIDDLLEKSGESGFRKGWK